MTTVDQFAQQIERDANPMLASLNINATQYPDKPTGTYTGFYELDNCIKFIYDGWYVVLTGIRGHGKTTWIRQLVLSAYFQNRKPFYFCGEEYSEKELVNLVKLLSKPDEIIASIDEFSDKVIYLPTRESFERNKKILDGKIKLSSYFDLEKIKRAMKADNKFKPIRYLVFDEMKRAYANGCRFFMLDNLMKLTSDAGDKNIFNAQLEVVDECLKFTRDYKTPVILVNHPNESGKTSAGRGEIVNGADAHFNIRRLMDEGETNKMRELLGDDCPIELKNEVSGYISILKGREDSTLGRLLPLTWDKERSALLSMTTKIDHNKTHAYWTKAYSRYSDDDIPDYDKQYK